MLVIPGYTLVTPVSEDGDLWLYQAIRMVDGLSVLLKIPTELSSPVLKRLEHEYEIARDLNPDRISRPIALERYGETLVLVLEKGPTRTLASLPDSPMDIRSFLRAAIRINAALADLHSHQLIHKDLKPEHVLLNEDGHVWLTGLGIASRVPREHQLPEPPEAIAGTLAYMAPEQTGRMNRSIYFRSDLYALGINFYRMLTGALPFTADDPMEWVHCHIARQPVPPSRRVPNIPDPLSEIVMKLLAKTAEERYQSAAGLDADLRHCLAEWESKGHITSFHPGAHDTPDLFIIQEKLYGRESEIESLIAAFNRVVDSGTPELVLVSGYSGIGKTSVVHELHRALVTTRGLFAAGKFDQYQRDIPYATLVQALQTLVRYILGKSEADVEEWRDAMQKAVSPNGELIISLIPEVKLIIGEQPPVPELPPREARHRFQMVLLRFIGVFATSDHPLVLFLDDLQWLDAATLDLLTHLAGSEVRSLLFVGAYRDNEVTPAHPLMQTLETIRKGGASVQDIVLSPLSINNISDLIADSLHCTQEYALPLAQLLHEKTGGNPFFAIQFLTALAEEKLITFDRDSKRWTWDLARIHARGFADNVVDLMLDMLARQPEATQEALKDLACLGKTAGIDALAMIHGITEEEIHTALWQAILAGLVFRKGNTYSFLHDRIQQAAYSMIPEGLRAEVHLRIGRLLLSHTPEEHLTENIFEIVGQMNRGSSLIAEPGERERLAELNLMAGKRARAGTAFASAHTYFNMGSNLLAEDIREHRRDLAFDLEFNRAVCEFLTGNMEAAEDHLALLAKRIDNLVDASAVACKRIDVYTAMNRNDLAIKTGLEYLRQVGIDWSPHPTDEEVQKEYEQLLRQPGIRKVEDLINLPSAAPDQRAIVDVLALLYPPAQFSDRNLFSLIVARISNLSMEYGNSDGSCMGYVWLYSNLSLRFGDYELGYRFARLACDLVEKRGLVGYEPRVYQVFGYAVSPWTRHLNKYSEMIWSTFNTALEIGDIAFAVYAWNVKTSIRLEIGDYLPDVQVDVEKASEFSHKSGFDFVVDNYIGQLRLIKNFMGQTSEFGSFNGADFDETEFEAYLAADPQRSIARLWYWMRRLQALSYAGNYTAALEAASIVKQMLWVQATIIEGNEYHVHSALALAGLYGTVSADEQAQYMKDIVAHHRQLSEWAGHGPANFENGAALVAAEIARLEGRDLEAMRNYEEAIQSARENGFVQREALANELASGFYRARGFETIADTYLREARNCYVRWGADGKVKQLEHLHPQLAHITQGKAATLSEQLDMVSMTRAQRVISGEIHLDRLARTLLQIVMESAGAQTGFLAVEGAGELRAVMQSDNEGVHRIAFETSPQAENIPGTIVNYVRRSRDMVILNDAGTETSDFSEDRYLRHVKPRSVLCMAIQRQEKLLAVVYLENNLVSGAFTPEHRTVLEILAAQAAISLETAGVYEALQESEERLRLTMEATQIGVFDWDVDNDIWYVTPEYYTMLGYEPGDGSVNRTEWLQRVHPDDRDHVKNKIQAVLTMDPSFEQSRIYEYEARLRHADGTYRWQHVKSYGTEKSLDGRIKRILGVRIDVDERKRAEEEIRQLNQELEKRVAERTAQLEDANRELEAFAYSVSHDLRAPLRHIDGYVNLLVSRYRDRLDEKGIHYIDTVAASAHEMGVLIDDLLQFSRTGRVELHRDNVNMNRVLEEVVAQLKESYGDRKIDWVIGDLPDVPGDYSLLRQVWSNLVGNAVKYTRTRDVARIEIGARREGDEILFFIADNGVGFDMHYVGKLFGVFQRLHSAEEFDGTGIGLAIVHRIIIRHGGRVRAEGRINEGATFYFSLPGFGQDAGSKKEKP